MNKGSICKGKAMSIIFKNLSYRDLKILNIYVPIDYQEQILLWNVIRESLSQACHKILAADSNIIKSTRDKSSLYSCHAPLLEEFSQHHGHKGDPEVTPGTCGTIGERAQVILVYVKAQGH